MRSDFSFNSNSNSSSNNNRSISMFCCFLLQLLFISLSPDGSKATNYQSPISHLLAPTIFLYRDASSPPSHSYTPSTDNV